MPNKGVVLGKNRSCSYFFGPILGKYQSYIYLSRIFSWKNRSYCGNHREMPSNPIRFCYFLEALTLETSFMVVECCRRVSCSFAFLFKLLNVLVRSRGNNMAKNALSKRVNLCTKRKFSFVMIKNYPMRNNGYFCFQSFSQVFQKIRIFVAQRF